MANNVIKEKSMAFAKRILKFHRYLRVSQKERVLSFQILRSGTGIGANVYEAICSVSTKEFLVKMQIAF